MYVYCAIVLVHMLDLPLASCHFLSASQSVDSKMANYNHYYDSSLGIFQAETLNSQSLHRGNVSVNVAAATPPTWYQQSAQVGSTSTTSPSTSCADQSKVDTYLCALNPANKMVVYIM